MIVSSEERTTVTDEQSAASLGRRASQAALALFGRTIVVQGATVGGMIVLARILTPAQFGLYAIVTLLVSFFSAFSDVGLGAALIQQRDDPLPEELNTVFHIQLGLVILVTTIGFIAAPILGSLYNLDSAGVWLLRALLISLPLTLFRTIPAILLERRLSFGRLGFIEAIEVVVFQGCAIVFAVLDFGVWSFVWATLLRAVTGAIAAQAAFPWRPRLMFARGEVIRLLRFGVPFQAQILLNVVKEAMTPTVLALLIGTTAIGYINWAYSVASFPLIITTIFSRVTFPAFSRVQQDKELLRKMVERSIRLSAITFLPLSCLLIGAGSQIVTHVFTDKWLPALPAMYLFSISLWAGPLIGATFFSLLYATDRARVALIFAVSYTVLDWVIGIPLVFQFGFLGIPIRSIVVACVTLAPLIYVIRRIIPISIAPQIIRPIALAVVVATLEALLLRVLPDTLPILILAVASSASLYCVLIALVERPTLQSLAAEILPPRIQQLPVLKLYF